jgi:SAM-dependent methyltransferase
MHVPIDALRNMPNPCPDLYRCACGFVSVWPLPSAAQIASFYERHYYTDLGGATGRKECPASFLDKLRMHLAWRVDGDKLPTEKWLTRATSGYRAICDLGCGAGQHIKALRDAGREVSGVEPDPNAASNLSKEGLDVWAGTVEELPPGIRSRKFDAVIMMHVLEHCLDPTLAIRNAKSILRPGGILICEVPNQDALARRFAGPCWWHFDVPRHLRFFTGPILSKLIKQNGLSIKRVSYVRYCAQFMNLTISEERRSRQTLGFGPWNSKAKAWLLLVMTAFAPARLKYDSVRIVAEV